MKAKLEEQMIRQPMLKRETFIFIMIFTQETFKMGEGHKELYECIKRLSLCSFKITAY